MVGVSCFSFPYTGCGPQATVWDTKLQCSGGRSSWPAVIPGLTPKRLLGSSNMSIIEVLWGYQSPCHLGQVNLLHLMHLTQDCYQRRFSSSIPPAPGLSMFTVISDISAPLQCQEDLTASSLIEFWPGLWNSFFGIHIVKAILCLLDYPTTFTPLKVEIWFLGLLYHLLHLGSLWSKGWPTNSPPIMVRAKKRAWGWRQGDL